MTTEPSTTGITLVLDTLSFERQLALGISVSKEFHPYYEAFLKKHPCSGNAQVTSGIIAALEHSATEKLSTPTLKVFSDILEDYRSHVEEFQDEHGIRTNATDDEWWVVTALDVIEYTVSFLQTGDAAMIGLALESVGEGYELNEPS